MSDTPITDKIIADADATPETRIVFLIKRLANQCKSFERERRSETATPSEQSVKDARRLWTEDTDPLVESVCRELLRLAGDKNAAPQLHGEGLAQNTPSAAPIAESASRCVGRQINDFQPKE